MHLTFLIQTPGAEESDDPLVSDIVLVLDLDLLDDRLEDVDVGRVVDEEDRPLVLLVVLNVIVPKGLRDSISLSTSLRMALSSRLCRPRGTLTLCLQVR